MRKSLLGTTALAAVAMTMFAAAGPARATPHMHTLSLAAPATPIGSGDFASQNLTLEKFDTALGNLKSVVVVEKLSASYSGAVTASSTTNATSATPMVSTKLSVTGGPIALDGTPLLAAAGFDNVTGVTPATPQTYAASNTPVPVSQTMMTGLSDWESTGPGNFVLTLDSTTHGSALPNGWGFDPTVDLNFAVDYTYNYTTSTAAVAAPEPTSALMLGAGVLALGVSRRRRKQRT